ncbi:MAG: hypothetical protein AB1473_08900 [Thermodesulfobacteriota bacterium]
MRWTMIALALALVAALSFSVPAYAHWRGGWYGGYSAGYYSPYFYSSGWGYPAGTYYYSGSPGYFYYGYPKYKKFHRSGYRTYYRW